MKENRMERIVTDAMNSRATCRLVAFIVAFGLAISLTGNHSHAEDQMTLIISSTAFEHAGAIPKVHTCQGEDISPALTWEGTPGDTRSLVLIVDDPDAPDPQAPKMTWVHWVLYNIPPATSGLAESIASADLPPGTKEGLNDWKRTGYGGPCPPIGRHRYFFKLYALDTTLTGLGTPTKPQVEAAMRDHILATAELMGTYQKSR